jgi:hypothetical protein
MLLPSSAADVPPVDTAATRGRPHRPSDQRARRGDERQESAGRRRERDRCDTPDRAAFPPRRLPTGGADAATVHHRGRAGRHKDRDTTAAARHRVPIIHRDAATQAARKIPCDCRQPF